MAEASCREPEYGNAVMPRGAMGDYGVRIITRNALGVRGFVRGISG